MSVMDMDAMSSVLEFGGEVVNVFNSSLGNLKLSIDDGHWWSASEGYFVVSVAPPETKKKKLGKNKELYAVNTGSKQWMQLREEKDFKWLRDQFVNMYPGLIIPSLGKPNKPSAHFPVDPSEDRRRQLERFLVEVVRHPVLRSSPATRHFLAMAANGDKSTKRAFKESRKNVEKDPLAGKAFLTRIEVFTDPTVNGGYRFVDEFTLGSEMAIPTLRSIEASSIGVGDAAQNNAQALGNLAESVALYQHPADSPSLVAAFKAVATAAGETAKLEHAHSTSQNVLIRRIRAESRELQKQTKVATIERKSRKRFTNSVLKLQKKGIEATAQQREDTLTQGGTMRARASVALAELNLHQHNKAIDFKEDFATYARLQIEHYEKMAEEWRKAAAVIDAVEADASWYVEQ